MAAEKPGRLDEVTFTLPYCNVVGDEVATTWNEACADMIVEGLSVRLPPTYRGQRSYPGLCWSAHMGGHLRKNLKAPPATVLPLDGTAPAG